VGGVIVVALRIEINRAPFDFIEGESELVSGFNIEVGAQGFAFIFMGEYLLLLFFTVFLVRILCNSQRRILFIFLIFFLFSRCVFPRYRYDKFLYLVWKKVFFLRMFFTTIMLYN